jgi:uncharacterized protein
MRFLFIFLLLFSCSSFAASFDCSKATTNHEKMICSNQELNEADSLLGKTYKDALSVDKSFINSTQKVFLKYYRQCSDVKKCLSIVRSRTEALRRHHKLLHDIQTGQIEKDYEISALKKSCETTKGIVNAVITNNNKNLIKFIDIDEEMSNGPRIKDLQNNQLNQLFDDDWFKEISIDLCDYYSLYNASAIGLGNIYIDLYNDGNFKIIAMNGYKDLNPLPSLDPIWEYKNIKLKPQCFTTLWMSGDNYEEYYDFYFNKKESSKHFENPEFLDFINNPGKYFGHKIKNLDPIDSPWEKNEKIAISVPVDICASNKIHSGGYIKEKSSDKFEYLIDQNYYQVSYHDDYNSSEAYRKIKKLNKEQCERLSNKELGECKESYVINTTEYSGGSMGSIGRFYVYGIFNINDKDYIVPLKLIGNYNDTKNFIEKL